MRIMDITTSARALKKVIYISIPIIIGYPIGFMVSEITASLLRNGMNKILLKKISPSEAPALIFCVTFRIDLGRQIARYRHIELLSDPCFIVGFERSGFSPSIGNCSRYYQHHGFLSNKMNLILLEKGQYFPHGRSITIWANKRCHQYGPPPSIGDSKFYCDYYNCNYYRGITNWICLSGNHGFFIGDEER